MSMNMTGKIMTYVIGFAVFCLLSYTITLYINVKREMIVEAGDELVSSARITASFFEKEMMDSLKSGDKAVVNATRDGLVPLITVNKSFASASILDENGKNLVLDKTLLAEGLSEGTVVPFIDVLTSEKGYTDVYELNGVKRITGAAPVKDEKGATIGYLTIDTKTSFIEEQVMKIVIDSVLKSLVLPLLGALAIFLYMRKAMRPLSRLSEEIKQIAQGDLTFDTTVYQTKDEIQDISESLHGMVLSLRSVLTQVAQTEDKLYGSSKELRATAQKTLENNQKMTQEIHSVEEGAKDQLFQTKESAAAMDEISSQVAQIAKNSEIMKKSTSGTASSVQEMATSIEQISKSSKNATNLATEVQESAVIGKNHVNSSREEMIAIAEIIQDTTTVMKKLGKSSEEIGSIVEVIDSIAEQTNLLALNAAIEAARAGEHGKGFSVVADEVKNLAERSANATKEIATLIQGIQRETKDAVDAIEVGNEKVNRGTELAQSASVAIVQIVTEIGKISEELSQISHATSAQATESNSIVQDITKLEEQVNQVAKATHEQTIGVNEITKSISKIASISQDSTNQLQQVRESSVEDSGYIKEIANDATALEGLSVQLKELMAKFKV